MGTVAVREDLGNAGIHAQRGTGERGVDVNPQGIVELGTPVLHHHAHIASWQGGVPAQGQDDPLPWLQGAQGHVVVSAVLAEYPVLRLLD